MEASSSLTTPPRSPSSSWKKSPSPPVISVMPVGDFERVLRKESAKRRTNNISFLRAVIVVVASVVFLVWVVMSSWATAQNPILYAVTNHSNGETMGVLVTPPESVARTPRERSYMIEIPKFLSGKVVHHNHQVQRELQQQHQQAVQAQHCNVPAGTVQRCAAACHQQKPSLEASFMAAMHGISI